MTAANTGGLRVALGLAFTAGLASVASGQGWMEFVPTLGSPVKRIGSAMAFESSGARIILYGGHHDVSPGGQTDTWAFDGSLWVQLSAEPFPGGPPAHEQARSNHAMVYDSARDEIVLFGGQTNPACMGPCPALPTNTTWVFKNGQWTDLTPQIPLSPSPRISHSMAYDSARDKVVLFGGYDHVNNIFFDDTWEWDGATRTWTQILVLGPSKRIGHSMAYDAARGRVVLLGGYTCCSLPFVTYADTWEWNGSAWVDVTPLFGGPGGIRDHALAYNPGAQQVLLFGGSTATGLSAKTWTWNGASWTDITPTDPLLSPIARSRHAMAYDDTRKVAVVFGGALSGGGMGGDTWEYAGSEWTWDGNQGGASAGVAGDPLLTGEGPYSGAATATLHLTDAAPSTIAALVAGLSKIDLPIFGGLFVPTPQFILEPAFTTSPTGTVDWSLPPTPSMLPGTSIWWQFFVYDTTSVGEFSISNALLSISN
jgi:hypothetical protein